MSSFFGLITKAQVDSVQTQNLLGAINLRGDLKTELKNVDYGTFGAAWRKDAPLSGKRLFKNAQWICIFSGDIIEYESIPFEQILHNLNTREHSFFSGLNGIFAIAAYNQEESCLYLISDRRSQQPIYYLVDSKKLFFSTDLAAFCRLENSMTFDPNWLYEYLYFNFPIGDTTFLTKVKRMPSASILSYSRCLSSHSITEYAPRFTRKGDLQKGRNALQTAKRVFEETIPKYFDSPIEKACALTGGWDGRTLLALSQSSEVTAYTYGIPGCSDLVEATKTARLAAIPHRKIFFDNNFLKDLQQYMLQTVYLSSGLQGILRASLAYAYNELTKNGTSFPLTVSGISVDMQFRGHAHSPALVSTDMARLFQRKDIQLREPFWHDVLHKDSYDFFWQHIRDRLEYLKEEFGDFANTDHHLSYILYCICPSYFAGELRIGDKFTTVRVPAWDSRIIDLSYSIEHSTLSYSEFSNHIRGSKNEMILQAFLLKTIAPRFAKISIGNIRPDLVLSAPGIFQGYRVLRAILARLSAAFEKGQGFAPLENWNLWLNHDKKTLIEDLLFSSQSRIRKFVSSTFLQKLRDNSETHYKGKLATAEIILRLIENGWTPFW